MGEKTFGSAKVFRVEKHSTHVVYACDASTFLSDTRKPCRCSLGNFRRHSCHRRRRRLIARKTSVFGPVFPPPRRWSHAENQGPTKRRRTWQSVATILPRAARRCPIVILGISHRSVTSKVIYNFFLYLYRQTRPYTVPMRSLTILLLLGPIDVVGKTFPAQYFPPPVRRVGRGKSEPDQPLR